MRPWPFVDSHAAWPQQEPLRSAYGGVAMAKGLLACNVAAGRGDAYATLRLPLHQSRKTGKQNHPGRGFSMERPLR